MLRKYFFNFFLPTLCLIILNVSCVPTKIDPSENEVIYKSTDPAELNLDLQEQAKNMLKYMNRSVDPCENFHQFACGNWKKYHEIPPDYDTYNLFTILNRNLRDSLHDILVDVVSSKEDVKTPNSDEADYVRNLVRILYDSCTDIDTIVRRGTEPLMEFMPNLGSFPLLDPNWSAADFKLEEELAKHALYDMETIFNFSVDVDLEEGNKTVVFIYNPSLGLPSLADYLEPHNKHRLDAYRVYLIESLRLIATDESKIAQVADEIIDLEVKLANLTDTKSLSNVDLYIVRTVGELLKHYPKFNWQEYLRNVLHKDLVHSSKVAFFTGPNLDQIYELLVNTEKRVIANYLAFNAVQQMFGLLDDKYRQPTEKLSIVLTGSEAGTKDRGLKCTTKTNNELGLAVSSIYVKKYFDENSKKDISRIAAEIKETFRENLYEAEWLDDETRKLAEEKVNETRLALGYPDLILNQTALRKYYKGLKLMPGKYFENVLNLRRFKKEREIKKLEKEIDRNEWPVNPTVVNAFFENDQNRIIIPASFLQPPIYHKNLPKAMNYGAVGTFMGHELTHGFDSDGRSYDKYGKIKNWWTNQSLESFSKKEKCFIDHYGQFSIYNKSLDGDLTKKENIADNGGIRLSYEVYQRWLKTRTDEEIENESLPGLEFISPTQLFFLSFAQTWCDYIRPEAIEQKLSTEEHPPGRLRLIGVLRNFDEFAKAYQCKENTYMNPTDKCKLW